MDKLKKNIQRFDNVDNSDWMTEPFTRTVEGFLKGRAIVTSIGVFTYMKADGTVQRELRLPEEVFNFATLDSMKLKPVTLNHPKELVTSDNAKDLQVGSLGDNPSYTNQEIDWNGNFRYADEVTDGINCAIDMMITQEDAINEVLNGKQSLSMGYTCDLEVAQPDSYWCGIGYDFIQRNIRYNHCAIVDAARAGDNAKIELRLDSEDAILQDKIPVNKHTDSNGGTNMKKIVLDGIEYEAEESVIKALNETKMRADKAEKDACEKQKELDEAIANAKKAKDELEKKLSEVEAEKDTEKEKADKLEKENEELKKTSADSKKLDEAVKAKLELMRNADKVGVEVKDDMKDEDIKKAIILSQFPNAKFDGKDDVYIQARYDATLEIISEKNDSDNRTFSTELPPTQRSDENDARNRMIARMKNHGKEN